ncbi:MAG: VOC family protein [Paracoccaceae bacterium]|nr:VOC family protein [Paracoccaceae bacterium]
MNFDVGLFSFHHIGVACLRIDREIAHWSALGYGQEGDRFEDPLQGVAGIFMTGPGPRMELLQELPGSDTLTPFLAAGTRMYHQAFEVPEFENAISYMAGHRARVLSPPKPAVAFGGRQVVFMMQPNRAIVELIEA